MLASGTNVGRYVVIDQLGEGAMGAVYRAWDNALDRVVALKIMLPLRAESAQARKRFEREARLTARINHPSVAHVYDVGEYDDGLFIAMEFVPGKQLREEMQAPVPARRVVYLARQILEGLSEAHHQGVVHRDLKPENILLSGRDQVKILDFGLAKPISDELSEITDLSTTGLTGTPRYMAPEQIQGTAIDPRTDLYALGAVLYELLTAHPVHRGETLGDLLYAIVHKPAPELTADVCPAKLGETIQKALKKDPAERFPSAQAMLDSLSDLDASGERSGRGHAPEHVPHPRAETYCRRAREALTGMGASSSLVAEMLERALEIDPDYALAHAIYAEASAAAFNTGQVDGKWLDRAQAALDRAEQLDPTLPDLRVARARIVWNKTFNFPAETALRELRLALRSAPKHVGALRLWATITAHIGLFEHAEAAVAQLQAMDASDPLLLAITASLHLVRGNLRAALEELAPQLRLDPKHEEVVIWSIQAHALTLMGSIEDADRSIQATLRRHPNDPQALSISALHHALRGDARGARAIERITERSIRGEIHPHHAYHLIACAESVLGDPRAALPWLKRCADEGMPVWPWFNRDPMLANLRADPEGAEYLQNLHRRHLYFEREFPLIDRAAALSFVATEVDDH